MSQYRGDMSWPGQGTADTNLDPVAEAVFVRFLHQTGTISPLSTLDFVEARNYGEPTPGERILSSLPWQ